MHNRCIDENNLTFLQKVGGQGRIKRKFLYDFIEKKKNISDLQKVLNSM